MQEAPPSSETSDATKAPARHAPAILFGLDGLRPGWSLLLFLLLTGVLLTLTRNLISGGPHPAHTTERTVASVVRGDGILFLILVISSLALSLVERRPFAQYGIGLTPRAGRQFAAGLVWGLLSLSALVLTLQLTHLLAFDARLLSGVAILRFGAEWAAGFLLVALFEEFFLRGFLQFTLARAFSGLVGLVSQTRHIQAIGFWTAALLLSFVFGLGHRSNPGESSLGLLTAGVAGLVFCLSLWRSGSLWWAIGFHASWDWAQSFLYGVADSGAIMQHHLLATHPVGRPILSGGLTGPEGSVFVLPTLALVAAIIWTTLHGAWPLYPVANRPEPSRLPEPNEVSS